MPSQNLVHQYKIVLGGVNPTVWRRIQVPATYSFWDLHVAIQDAMGWLDYHLHLFTLSNGKSKKPFEIGIPDEDDLARIQAGWEVRIDKHFTTPGSMATYDYDFGDGWSHQVVLEGLLLAESETRYPKCISGQNACPPEDCGGTHGYERLLQTLQAPGSEQYYDMLNWLKNHAKNYLPFIPSQFDSEAVKFSDPKKRWSNAFGKKARIDT